MRSVGLGEASSVGGRSSCVTKRVVSYGVAVIHVPMGMRLRSRLLTGIAIYVKLSLEITGKSCSHFASYAK